MLGLTNTDAVCYLINIMPSFFLEIVAIKIVP